LILVGATAIEDKLQEGVPHAIHNLRRAGIKVWVITGDKQETAINIGYSSRLLAPHMRVVKINAASSEDTGALLASLTQDNVYSVRLRNSKIYFGSRLLMSPFFQSPPSKAHPLAAVVDGKTLSFILADHKEPFLFLVRNCVSVICNRVTPLQKAEVVKLVAEGEDAVTLSVGDGGNDVPMIQQAHIGVGIQGREGNQAARAADFAVPQFRHVERLLTVHGRYCLMRNTKIIYYSFYKNIATFMTQIWFSIFSGFSGQVRFFNRATTARNGTIFILV
jgi:phospholipid-transporting ATPase